MNKLIGVIIGQDAEHTIDLAMNSLKGCDNIIYIDGGSTDTTLALVDNFFIEQGEGRILENEWNKTKDNMASIQKNFILKHLKENHLGDWVIYIDADEMLDDGAINIIKTFIENVSDDTEIYDVRMRHLMYNLALEDSVHPVHRTPTRLFKVTEKIFFPKGNHVTLKGGKNDNSGFCPDVVLWHFAYCGGIWDIKKRYDGQKIRRGPQSHKIENLKQWKNAHLFGGYPISNVDETDLPEALLEQFDIDKDELYFQNRGMELKHSIMVKQWNDYFKPESVTDLGCGRGPYLFFWDWYVGHSHGIDLSQWAVAHAFVGGIGTGNIAEESQYLEHDLITAIDVLEHLTDEDLDKTLKNMSKYGKQFLFSIPFIGDPNLEADKTHIQKKTKEDWIKLIQSYGITINPTPLDWMFKEQILIGTTGK